MDSPVNTLSLFSGAGGLDLGLRMALPGCRVVAYVEREGYACEVLASRMEEGRLDLAPIWTDVRTFDGRPWRGVVDLIAAGYPCQPYSAAGKRLGDRDHRALWPHVRRIVDEVRPAGVFLENVAHHVARGFEGVWNDLCERGFAVEAGLFTAAEVGAGHLRRRLFVLAHSQRGFVRVESGGAAGRTGKVRPGLEVLARQLVANPNERGQQEERSNELRGDQETTRWDHAYRCGLPRTPRNWIGPQPAVRRDADGMADRVDRLRLCGNGVVPQQAALAFRSLWSRAVSARPSTNEKERGET